MEDFDKKKKRNKKKKNKQTKLTEDLAAGVDQNGASDGNNENHQVIDLAIETRNGASQNAIMGDMGRHEGNGTEISILNVAEKQQWLQREAILKGTIRQLQHDKDSHIQKEAILEEKVKLLLVENDSVRQKQASLEEMINQLRNINYSTTQKEVTLKETNKQLKNENDVHILKEAGLEKKIVQLQSEKELYLQKEAGLEGELQHLLNEKTLLVVKLANLEEKIKLLKSDRDSLTLTETAAKETIASMNVNITRLRMQVVELEESRKSVMKENQQLMENMSGLQLQLQNLETSASTNTSNELKKLASEPEDKDSQIEAACALIDKLITENAELMEKVNELYIKLDQQRSAAGLSSLVSSDGMAGDAEVTTESVSVSESGEYALDHKLEALEVEPVVGDAYDVEIDSGEIVQIPLDDNPPPDLELQVGENGDKLQAVPLSDAPLTGAPLRIISFFARYVSGADLVDKN